MDGAVEPFELCAGESRGREVPGRVVGNRLTEQTRTGTTAYVYDNANRLTSVGGVTYSRDNNGNLLSDRGSTYTFDHAHRLKSVTQGSKTYTYAYNGLGNRVSQAVNGGTPTRYVLDQAAGLVQVLSSGAIYTCIGETK
jgi:YD repeat-containing protein